MELINLNEIRVNELRKDQFIRMRKLLETINMNDKFNEFMETKGLTKNNVITLPKLEEPLVGISINL